jgi:hypothetical protein
MLELWGNVGFLVLTGGSIIFTLLYLSLSRWYKNFMGTLIAVHLAGIDFLCAYLSLRIWDIDVPGVEWVRLLMFWILGVGMITASVGLVQVQFGSRGARLRNRLTRKYVDVGKDNKEKEGNN